LCELENRLISDITGQDGVASRASSFDHRVVEAVKTEGRPSDQDQEKMDDNQTSEETKKQREELLRLLSDVKTKATQLENMGQEIVQSARFAQDVAAPTLDYVSEVPSDSLAPKQVEHQIEAWRAWQVAAGQLGQSLTTVNTFSATSYAVASTSSETLMMFVTPSTTGKMLIARTRLNQVLERAPLVDAARSSMRRLGLDSRGGSGRTALELLEEAKGALGGGPVPVLIPVRECILVAIGELLRRRPTQRAAAKTRDKLASIGDQCARPGLAPGYFEGLAMDGDSLLNTLSGAKQVQMSDEQVSELFHRAVVFLNALLSSIDERQLKS